MKPIVIGIDSKCEHGEVTAIDEIGCDLCVLYAILDTCKFPVKVRYIGKSAVLDKDSVYTAVGFIRKGKMADGGVVPGILLRTNHGDATLKSFPPADFEFVEDDE